MSAYSCGCDPECGDYRCSDYPFCAYAKAQRKEDVLSARPIEPMLIYGSTPGAEQTPAFKAVRQLIQDGIDNLPDPIDMAERADELLTGKWEGVVPERDCAPRELSLNGYQRSLHTYKDRHHECHALGLVGELAEVVDELKKDPKWLSIDRDFIADVLIAAGNVADMVKKATAHGVPLDREKLKKELGDALWYITAVAGDNGLTLQDIAEANVAKLRKRYPEGFVKGGGVREESVGVVGGINDALERTRLCPLPANHPGWPQCPLLHIIMPRIARSVSFGCGCSEQTIDGVMTRRYCPNGECRRLAR